VRKEEHDVDVADGADKYCLNTRRLAWVCEFACISAFLPEIPGMASVLDGSVGYAFLCREPAFEPWVPGCEAMA
jgi:hypothetical protein